LDDADSPGGGPRRLRALVDELDRSGYTAASNCLPDDLDALVVHLRYPLTHRRRWRPTNLFARSLAEVKRRTKVIGRFPDAEPTTGEEVTAALGPREGSRVPSVKCKARQR
jgi:putative transposase